MSVFGSLFTAVSGLEVQSSAISMISNNIANVNTTGYKRTDASFASLVTTSSRSTAYSPGSVKTIQSASITEQGILQQTSSETDIAISGNGFFVVNTASDGTGEPLYTRSGSFSEDSSGVLVNSSGFYLMGWALDQDGNLPASQADSSSLSVVDVSFLGGLTLPTTTASIAMNLQADEESTDYASVSPGFDADFSRSITVYDSLGEAQTLTASFKKITSPTANLTGDEIFTDLSDTLLNEGILTSAGSDITVTVTDEAASSTSYTVLDAETKTISEIIEEINTYLVNGDGESLVYATLDDDGFLSITTRNIGDSLTLTDNGTANGDTDGDYLADLGFIATSDTAPLSTSVDLLTSLDDDELANTEGWWVVEYSTASGAVIESGVVNFTGDGSLNANENTDGEVIVELLDIDWGTGAEIQDIDFDLSGFSQFSGQYNVISSDQNGAELGLRTGVSIDEDGYVVAQFSNGQSKKIYKLALATFANENGLTELSGNVYRESDTSGSFNLREANTGSAGTISSGALEASNVDLADEFSKMIVTQRAYSANTKVISTADSMLEELLRLR